MAEPRGVGFPFRSEPEGFPVMETGSALDESSLKQILLTELGERRMRPGFGSKLRQFLFEPRDEGTKMAIQAEVYRAVRDSTDSSGGPPRFAIIGVDVTFENDNSPHKTPFIAINVVFTSFGRKSQVQVFVGV